MAIAALVAGLLIGLLIGLAAGGGDDESAKDGLEDMRSQLQDAANLLEIMQIEYGESVQGGRVVSEPEYRGARSALDRSQTEYRDARETLVLANPQAATRLDETYAELGRLVTERAAPARVNAAAERAKSQIAQITDSSG